jgi:hypothetical protein
MRLAATALALALLTSACQDLVIPTEEEAASAGQSAAAAADAFISVFEERAEAERAELMAQLEDTSEPLFTTTTVDPLDLFDPINDCNWGEPATLTQPAFTLQHPAFVEFDSTPDALGGFHAAFDYGGCAPIVGDLSVLSFVDPPSPQVVVESQVNAYRTVENLTLVSSGPVSIPGAVDPGYQIEIRTSGDTHRIFVGVRGATGDVVVLTIHVPIAEWDRAAPVALDLLRGLSAG